MRRAPTEEFLLQLKARDVRVWLDGERVRVSAPKNAAIPDLREELAARKEEIASFLKNVESRDGGRALVPTLKARHDESAVPLSFGQQRVWILHEINKEEGLPYDTLAWNLRIRGQLNIDALRSSLSEIVRRHEILRTTFRMREAEPVQVIAPAAPVALPEIDLRGIAEGQREETAQRLLREARHTFFDLAHGPLLRTSLIRLGEADWILVMLLHHIVFDAWSMTILTRELARLYEDFTAGREPSLPELPIQYGDFAVWQRQWLQGEVLGTHLDYWRRRLEGLGTLELPLDHPRPAVQTYGGARESIHVGADVAAELIRLSKARGLTSFMTMLGALSVLLFRYTGQSDVAIGTPITNRDREELQDLIGFFLNTLVMRVDLSGDPTFDDVLAQVKRTVLEGFSHQHLPLEVLVDKLKVARDPSRTPLFQVQFVLQHASEVPPLQLKNLHISAVESAISTTRFDLEFYVYQENGGFSVSCLYNTDLFDAGTIRRMLGHYERLLRGTAANPQARIGQVRMLTNAEMQQALIEWNRTDAFYPGEQCLHRLVEAQAQRTPEAIAVEFEDEALTYLELEQRASGLARHLGRLGVRPGVLVGVFMERSLEMVVALYGILKSGGAYVPLDPEYPPDRIAFMMEDANASVLLTQQHLRERLPRGQAAVVCLDTQWETIAKDGDARLPDAVTAEDLAYVTYTSGSTGRPKGVLNTHKGIVNRLRWGQKTYRLTAEDRVLQKTPFTFDVSVWEFFWPLMSGARLVMARPGGHKDPAYLSKTIADKKITTLHFVPSMLEAYLDSADLHAASLKRVICSGEALSYELQERFFRASGAELHNLYGPTEAAVEVTNWACRRGDRRRVVPIGRPIANTRIYILDREKQPVPVGIAGELHIGGVQVAKGYLNRADLTAERFVPDPYSDDPAARLYKTGDLARYLPDGTIEYLGRMDNQVKLRGFRIELGEIEAVLAQHEGLRAAVVTLREDSPGDQRLVAYVVTHKDRTPTAEELRSLAGKSLPGYMVPSAFVFLDTLPLTPSGKTDRKALPAPPRAAAGAADDAAAPNGELEEVMARIWQELLDIDQVYASDTFFDLGGHSLLSIKAVRRFERETGIRIAPMDLVNQTLRQLVAGIEARRASADKPSKGMRVGILSGLIGSRS
jgi:amino acid adenylation domain-containing protein